MLECVHKSESRDRAVGKADGYGLDDRGSEFEFQ
jgi:hypothetical protein